MSNNKPELLSMKEMQHVYIELLAEFDQICKDNQLRYDLCGGTMLGAVRHQGFIPWDNDIDVSMPRPDYDRLIQLQLNGQLEFPAHRDVIMYQNHTFARHYARYIRYDVHRYSKFMEDDDCPYIGIDIFTVDGMPSDDAECRKQMKKIEKWRRYLLVALSDPAHGKRKGVQKVAKYAARLMFRTYGVWNICKKLDKMCRSVDYKTAEYVGICNGMYGTKERWLKKDMLPQKLWKFENGEYPGYVNADIYLSDLYGDYMKLPPVEQQVPHCDDGYLVEPVK